MRPQELLHVVHDLGRRLEQSATLTAIARRAGRSRFQFHRDFRKALGETPRAFVERLRLERAAAALLGTHASILAIALEAGFFSPEVFTRAFRRRFGCTPRHYRATALPHPQNASRARHLAFTTAIGPCSPLFHLPLQPTTRKSTMPTISVTRRQFAGQPLLLILRRIPRPEQPGRRYWITVKLLLSARQGSSNLLDVCCEVVSGRNARLRVRFLLGGVSHPC